MTTVDSSLRGNDGYPEDVGSCCVGFTAGFREL